MSEKKNTTTQKSKIYSVKVYLSLHCIHYSYVVKMFLYLQCNCFCALHCVCYRVTFQDAILPGVLLRP